MHGEFLHAGGVEAKTDESFSGHVFCFISVESDVFCCTSTAATERFNITEMSADTEFNQIYGVKPAVSVNQRLTRSRHRVFSIRFVRID